ncbi:MAG: hypothetical protein PHU85_11910 [Phycisphaerae bacterium]|nr:hypothetical protein [Phycisphaerae bacterium]
MKKYVVVGLLGVTLRLTAEAFYPFVPFATDNSFLRIVLEYPVYMGVAYVVEAFVSSPSHWVYAVAVAVVEAAVLVFVLVAVEKVVRAVRKRRSKHERS